MNPYMYGGASVGPYGGLYDTSGEGDEPDEPGDEEAAEILAEGLLDNQEADTGAVGFQMPSLPQIVGHVQTGLAGMLGGRATPPKVQKIVKKVNAKIQAKAPARAARAPMLRLPRPPAPSAPRPPMHFPQQPARPRNPINSIGELMQRVKWAQLASLTGNPLSVGISTTVNTTIAVTRTGWVLDWNTNQGSTGVMASNLTYAQMPNTIFNPTPLEAWAPQAANPTPIDPLFVTMPAALNVTLNNTSTTAAAFVSWTMSGIPAEHVGAALMDPDVVQFLASRGMEIAKAAQGGYGQY